MNQNDPKYLFRVPQNALIIENKKVLVLKRAMDEKSFAGLWDLAGGRLEHGENLKESLMREVKEETNLEVNILNLVSAFVTEVKDGFGVFLIYNCKKISDDIKVCKDDHSTYLWATKEEIEKLKKTPVLKYCLDEKLI